VAAVAIASVTTAAVTNSNTISRKNRSAQGKVPIK
jgi:hypothetical protein